MEEISSLNQTNMCGFNEIINSEEDFENKMVALYSNQAYSNLYNAFQVYNSYVVNNNLSEYSNDEDAKIYFTNRLLNDLEFDSESPNQDPCAAYKANIKSCAAGFTTCVFFAALTGPYAGIGVAACGLNLMYCVDAVDASYPNCVPSDKMHIILNPIIYNLDNC